MAAVVEFMNNKRAQRGLDQQTNAYQRDPLTFRNVFIMACLRFALRKNKWWVESNMANAEDFI